MYISVLIMNKAWNKLKIWIQKYTFKEQTNKVSLRLNTVIMKVFEHDESLRTRWKFTNMMTVYEHDKVYEHDESLRT